MHLRTLPLPDHRFTKANSSLSAHVLASFPPLDCPGKVVFHLKPNFGPCTLTKRVSRSRGRLGSKGGLVMVTCEGSNGGRDDGFYIRRCVELARKAAGCTSPNPMVGCVIVKDGKIVGEGFHPKAGQPHAEVFALRDAGKLAENATAYVSLEPCNHYGRTPPCTEALIDAKVKKIVIGMVDPNPIVASRGINRLRDAGIEVTIGVEEELCNKLNEAFIHQMLTGTPFLTLRYSISVDGHLQDELGDEVLDSGGYYSKLLQEVDAVIFSSSLLGTKFSIPVSREPGAKQPLQIVLARCPPSNTDLPTPTAEQTSNLVFFTGKETNVKPEAALGIETVVLDRFDLIPILEHCKRQGLNSVLVDLRGNAEDFEEIIKEGFKQNLFQKVVVEILPVSYGSGKIAVDTGGQKIKVKNMTTKVLKNSILLEGYFSPN